MERRHFSSHRELKPLEKLENANIPRHTPAAGLADGQSLHRRRSLKRSKDNGSFCCVLYQSKSHKQFTDCGKRKTFVSELRRHHERHDFHYCTQCFAQVTTPQEAKEHPYSGTCGLRCIEERCSNRDKFREAQEIKCKHGTPSQTDIWKRLYRLAREGEQVPEPSILSNIHLPNSSTSKRRSLLSIVSTASLRSTADADFSSELSSEAGTRQFEQLTGASYARTPENRRPAAAADINMTVDPEASSGMGDMERVNRVPTNLQHFPSEDHVHLSEEINTLVSSDLALVSTPSTKDESDAAMSVDAMIDPSLVERGTHGVHDPRSHDTFEELNFPYPDFLDIESEGNSPEQRRPTKRESQLESLLTQTWDAIGKGKLDQLGRGSTLYREVSEIVPGVKLERQNTALDQHPTYPDMHTTTANVNLRNDGPGAGSSVSYTGADLDLSQYTYPDVPMSESSASWLQDANSA